MRHRLILALLALPLGLRCRRLDPPPDIARTPEPRRATPHQATPSAAARAADEDEDEEGRCARVPGGVLDGERVAELCVDITETTTAHYRRCVEAGACASPTGCAGSLYDRPERAEHPVNCVTHDQAAAYCAWRRARLPSAREWQWAAQGGEEARPYPWGDAPPSCARANIFFGATSPPSALGECGRDWAAVGSRPAGASRHGLLDLQGNVAEWTSDVEGAAAVVKGVAANVDVSHEELDPAYAWVSDPTRPSAQIGIRCVRPIE